MPIYGVQFFCIGGLGWSFFKIGKPTDCGKKKRTLLPLSSSSLFIPYSIERHKHSHKHCSHKHPTTPPSMSFGKSILLRISTNISYQENTSTIRHKRKKRKE